MILAFEPSPSPSVAIATKEAVVLLSGAGKELRRVPIAARRLEWSPDGGTLAILAADRRLLVLKQGSEPLSVADEAADPAWSPDGRLFFTQGSKGIAVVLPAGTPSLVVPAAHSPAPSPDGGRLAFSTDGAQGGVWTAAIDGSGARRLLKGSRAGSVSWSYDGRWLAGVVDGHLRLVRSNGLAARDLGAVVGTTARWSGGATDLLARREKGWSVYGFLDDRWSDLDLDVSAEPRWVGPGRLLGIRGGSATEARLGGEAERLSAEVAVDAARVAGLYRGVSFPDRFGAAPRPTFGSQAWRGRIVSADPIGGVVTMSVDAEIDARGRETNFARAMVRRAKVPAGSLTRRLAVVPESDAWLVVARGTVFDAFLPDAPTSAALPVLAAAGGVNRTRANRAIEYDGVCRDRVVVPMVYPLPIRRRERDSFLFARDGGARRHHGNDLMAPKMTPLLAAFDGVVSFGRSDAVGSSSMLTLEGDGGYTAWYLHINNDTPGTDDGRRARVHALRLPGGPSARRPRSGGRDRRVVRRLGQRGGRGGALTF